MIIAFVIAAHIVVVVAAGHWIILYTSFCLEAKRLHKNINSQPKPYRPNNFHLQTRKGLIDEKKYRDFSADVEQRAQSRRAHSPINCSTFERWKIDRAIIENEINW